MPIGFEPATWAAATLAFTDHFDDAGTVLEVQRRRSIEAGDETSQSMVLAFLHQADLIRGSWSLARSRIDESVRLADLMEHPTARGLNRHWLARLQGRQGEIETARTTIAEGLALAEAIGDRLAEAGHLAVLCSLSLMLDDPAGAIEHAQRVRRLLPPGWDPPPWLMFEGDELDALVAVGRSAQAARQIASLRRRSLGEHRPRLEVWALRGQALQLASEGRLTDALDALESALGVHERLQIPFELARTLLVKGKVERRARHKAAARGALEQAIGLFDTLGAPIWSQKAREEHSRAGLRRSHDELSATEQKVADLAAAGKKNREIAAELFITRRTVEANLARAYRKLGVQSRAELGARMASMATTQAETAAVPPAAESS
jgi:DNA-binding CsgD family transcriptional regulator